MVQPLEKLQTPPPHLPPNTIHELSCLERNRHSEAEVLALTGTYTMHCYPRGEPFKDSNKLITIIEQMVLPNCSSLWDPNPLRLQRTHLIWNFLFHFHFLSLLHGGVTPGQVSTHSTSNLHLTPTLHISLHSSCPAENE